MLLTISRHQSHSSAIFSMEAAAEADKMTGGRGSKPKYRMRGDGSEMTPDYWFF